MSNWKQYWVAQRWQLFGGRSSGLSWLEKLKEAACSLFIKQQCGWRYAENWRSAPPELQQLRSHVGRCGMSKLWFPNQALLHLLLLLPLCPSKHPSFTMLLEPTNSCANHARSSPATQRIFKALLYQLSFLQSKPGNSARAKRKENGDDRRYEVFFCPSLSICPVILLFYFPNVPFLRSLVLLPSRISLYCYNQLKSRLRS